MIWFRLILLGFGAIGLTITGYSLNEYNDVILPKVTVTESQMKIADEWYGADPQNPMLGCGPGFTCVIHSNYGGRTVAFLAGAYELRQKKDMLVVIDDTCVSACATFAAYGRPQVCITPYTAFGFHQGTNHADQPLPPDIRDWVLKHGGFPAYETQRVTWMMAPDASMFWRKCW
jgi:hypothetical protein